MNELKPITTWRKLISEEVERQKESWNEVVACTLSNKELDVEFNCSYGHVEGLPFTLWTTKRVYFPVVYDGAEWVESVPRDPCGEKSRHCGG